MGIPQLQHSLFHFIPSIPTSSYHKKSLLAAVSFSECITPRPSAISAFSVIIRTKTPRTKEKKLKKMPALLFFIEALDFLQCSWLLWLTGRDMFSALSLFSGHISVGKSSKCSLIRENGLLCNFVGNYKVGFDCWLASCFLVSFVALLAKV